jgi:peptide/nickel transport system substrate-binding protein
MGESATVTANGQAASAPDASTFVKVEIGELESLDPAGPYDTRSWEVMANVYETLLARTLSGFAPRLAVVVPTADNGLVSADGLRYEFPIRPDVRFHDGEVLTADDVVYALRRLLVADIPGGPAWMLMEPLLGVSSSRDEQGGLQFGFGDVEQAIRAEGDRVVLRLRYPFAPLPAILATPPASIFPRSWAVAGGEWPGTAQTFEAFNRRPLSQSFLHQHMNGTAPYRFVAWEPDVRVDLARHPRYWGTPALVDRVVIYKENDWAGRRDALVSGEADMVQVDRTFVPEIAGNPDIIVDDDLPLPVCDTISFNLHVNPDDNPSLGSGRLDGQGIPPDFFNDLHVRRGFQYAFDWDRLISEVYLGKAVQARGPIPQEVFGHNPDQPVYRLDPQRAAAELRQAWDGRLWDVGFRLTLVFNTGNFLRRMWATFLADQLREINPKFVLETKGADLPEWRGLLAEGKLAIFTAGWLVDYLDPHNFVQPLMFSGGLWARWQSYANPEADQLIAAGARELDPGRRRAIYHRIQQIAYEDAKEIYTVEPLGLVAMRSWVTGWKYDMINGAITYFPVLGKEGSNGA